MVQAIGARSTPTISTQMKIETQQIKGRLDKMSSEQESAKEHGAKAIRAVMAATKRGVGGALDISV
jgi:hypothetical protein